MTKTPERTSFIYYICEDQRLNPIRVASLPPAAGTAFAGRNIMFGSTATENKTRDSL